MLLIKQNIFITVIVHDYETMIRPNLSKRKSNIPIFTAKTPCTMTYMTVFTNQKEVFLPQGSRHYPLTAWRENQYPVSVAPLAHWVYL